VEPTAVSPAPTDAGGDGNQTLNDLASRRLQGVVDSSITSIERGEFQNLPPKVVQLLAAYEKVSRPGNPERTPAKTEDHSDPYATIFGTPKTPPAADNPDAEMARIGRETVQKQVVSQIRDEVALEFLRDTWAEDVRALFGDLGNVTGVTDEDFASVDITQKGVFPFSKEGYRKWTQNANILRMKFAGDGSGTPAEKTNPGLAADKRTAARTRRTPGVTAANPAATDLKTKVQLRREGKMSREEFVKSVRDIKNSM
jgi:hypothetical protein